jgi:predicted transcriptional regulator
MHAVISDTIDHDTRRLIISYITANPGISFKTLEGMLNINRSTLRYHLDQLSRDNQISSRLEQGQRCYFTGRIDVIATVSPGLNLSTLTKEQRHILRLVRNSPGITKKVLVRKTRMNKNTLTYNLQKLMDRSLIWKVRSGRDTGYEFKSKEVLHKEMFKLLLNKFINNEIDQDTFLRLKEELDRKMN